MIMRRRIKNLFLFLFFFFHDYAQAYQEFIKRHPRMFNPLSHLSSLDASQDPLPSPVERERGGDGGGWEKREGGRREGGGREGILTRH
jgi:hypothetical protein